MSDTEEEYFIILKRQTSLSGLCSHFSVIFISTRIKKIKPNTALPCYDFTFTRYRSHCSRRAAVTAFELKRCDKLFEDESL